MDDEDEDDEDLRGATKEHKNNDEEEEKVQHQLSHLPLPLNCNQHHQQHQQSHHHSVLREWILEVREVKSEMKILFTHFEK